MLSACSDLHPALNNNNNNNNANQLHADHPCTSWALVVLQIGLQITAITTN